MSTLTRYYPGDEVLDFLLVVTLGVAVASSAAWLVSRRLSRTAALRHFVLFSGLVCCGSLPVLAWFFGAAGLTLVSIPVFCGEPSETPSKIAPLEIDPAGSPPRPSADSSLVAVELPSPPANTNATIGQGADVAAVCFVCPAEQSPATPMPSAPDARGGGIAPATLATFRGIASGAMFVWAAGAVLMLARLARNWGRVARLYRSSRPAQDGRLQALLRECAGRLGTHRVPALLVSRRMVTPQAAGFWRGAVILPECLLGSVNGDELRDVLMHELAHLRRGDQRVVLLQELAGAVYWPIVPVHCLNRELRRAREELCDNAVLASRDAIRYGETLLRVAELLVMARPMASAVGIIGGRGELERRVTRLIDPRRNTMTKTNRGTALVVTFLFMAGGALLSATRFGASAGAEEPATVTIAESTSPESEANSAPPALPRPSLDSKAAAENHGAPAANSEPGEANRSTESEAAEIQTYIRMFKLAPNHRADNYFSGIGSLVKSGYWIGDLPLADDQAEAITNLDDVVWGARVQSFSADIDYLEGNPADYREYVAHSNARRVETINHAQRMVTLGLLTEPQAALVIGRYLSGRWEELLWNMSVQMSFGITESQKVALEQIAERAQRRAAPLPMLPTDPEGRKRISAKYAAIRQKTSADVMEVLTPKQREMWDQLTAKRTLPAEPPDLPTLSDAEAARIKLAELSPTFRKLDETSEALGLSAEQTKLLNDLKQVTRLGLFWISLREPADPAALTRAKFLKHAEQVALLGILTEAQAFSFKFLC